MRLCYSHHIECRDIFHDQVINAILELYNTLVHDMDVAKSVGRNIGELTRVIELEGGCLACFYKAHFEKDLITLTKKRMNAGQEVP